MVLTRSGRQALIHLYPRSNRQAAATRLQSLPYTGRAPGTIRRRRHRPHARARIPPPPPPPPPPFQSAGLQQFRDATGLPNASAFYRAWGTQGADFQDTLLSHLNRRDINALGALDRNFRQNDHLTEHRLRPTLNAQAPRQPRPNGVQASCQETNVLPLPPTHQPSTYTPRCPNNYRSNVPIRWCDQNGPTHGALRQRYIGFNQALPPAQHPANYNVCGDHADITNQGPRAQLDLIQTRSPVCTRCERAELRRHDFDPYCGCGAVAEPASLYAQ
ncbi:hypothetical protein MMC20_001409 [Loxospora ochrophaea]|nr:hypothetical protein [Loxospora ochrophaea]